MKSKREERKRGRRFSAWKIHKSSTVSRNSRVFHRFSYLASPSATLLHVLVWDCNWILFTHAWSYRDPSSKTLHCISCYVNILVIIRLLIVKWIPKLREFYCGVLITDFDQDGTPDYFESDYPSFEKHSDVDGDGNVDWGEGDRDGDSNNNVYGITSARFIRTVSCVGSGDPVRVLRLYTMNTLDILWSIYCWDICTTCRYQI